MPSLNVTLTDLTPAHLPAVLSLIESLRYLPPLDLAWLRYRTLDDPTCLPDLLPLAEVEGQVVGFCFGCVREGRGVVKLFGVAEPYRRRGIGTALFAALEARLQARGITEITVDGGTPNYFTPGVDLAHTDAICFLMARGYQTDRVARVDMSVDLLQADLETAATEARLAAEGIILRRATPDEIPAAAQFALETFSAGWQREVADAARFRVPPLFIALHEGRIVSFAVYDVTGRARFGPTGTHPDYRQRGIGGALLKLCLRDLRDQGERVSEIGWTGPIPFYAHAVGARISRIYWTFRKTLELIPSRDSSDTPA